MIGHIVEKAIHPANRCECCQSGCDCGCVDSCPVCRGKSWRERGLEYWAEKGGLSEVQARMLIGEISPNDEPLLLATRCNARASHIMRQIEEIERLRKDAARYQWLRARDLDAIDKGGVFAGMTPQNVILNGDDLDGAIDAAIASAGN